MVEPLDTSSGPTRALSFGTDAVAYERFRLGYPDSVADLVLGYAQAPVTRALEVGAGTGKATRLIAGRGIEVRACEPDPAMAAVLRETTVGLPVTVVETTFERLGTGERSDLLYAAAAFHWTDPAGRWDRVAAHLRPGGTFLNVGRAGEASFVDPEVEAAYDAVVSSVLPDDQGHDPSPSGMHWPLSEVGDDPRFGELEQHVVTHAVERTREEAVGLLATISAVIVLPEADRAELLRRVAAALPDRAAVAADVRVHLARRIGG